MRKRFEGRHSLERLYGQLSASLPHWIRPELKISRFVSQGLFRRVYNMIEAAFRQGDVNHVTGDTYFLSLFLRRRRTLLTVHDVTSLDRLRGMKRFLLLNLWYRFPIRRAGIVTAVSEATRRRLIQLFGEEMSRVRVVGNFVFPEFEPSPRAFDADRPVILQIGTYWNKNLERVIPALEGIRCHLRVVGRLTPGQLQLLRQHQVDYSEALELSDAEMLEEYRRCDMVVLASLDEGFGLPIIEAQAVGRPVVTSDVSSMPEVAGDGAALVDPTDVASIRAGVLRVIGDAEYRVRLVQHGARNASRFSAESVAAQYAAIYRELAS